MNIELPFIHLIIAMLFGLTADGETRGGKPRLALCNRVVAIIFGFISMIEFTCIIFK